MSILRSENFLRFHGKTRVALVAAGLFIAVFIGITLVTFFRPPLLRMSFYDIGQGDAFFLETPHHFQMLVDGGPGSGVLEKLAADMPFYDRTIDLVIATHPDSDHIAGLVDVLNRYHVNTILLPRVGKKSVLFDRFLEAIRKNGASVREGAGPQTIMLDQGISFTVLNPRKGETYSQTNDFGIAGLLRYGKLNVVLTADITGEREEAMMPFLPSPVDILKVAHHGSKYSSSLPFLRHILPHLAVISVGKNNRYGHPTPEALARLARVGAHIWRTDQGGDLRVFSDGKSYWTTPRALDESEVEL